MTPFALTESQVEKLRAWSEEQDRIAFEAQKAAHEKGDGNPSPNPVRESFLAAGRPYYGATGGSLTYCFTPTSIGTGVVVKHGFTGAEIDLSDYDSW